MAEPVIRIFSDLHYGDRASALTSLAALHPLFEGASELVLNGDTLDTRLGPSPETTRAVREEVDDFVRRIGLPVRVLTGNHDPDYSGLHALELGNRSVFVTHGDVLYDDIVPWSREARLARRLLSTALGALAPAERPLLEHQFAALRRAAAAIPQRHPHRSHGVAYALSYLSDTVWPPTRIWRVIRAWRETPVRVRTFLHRHRIPAQFFVMGHTHRLGVNRTGDVVILNTGSFAPPSGAGVVEIRPGAITLRRVERRRGEFRLGAAMAEFPLADEPGSGRLAP